MMRKQRQLVEQVFRDACGNDPILLLELGEYERLDALFHGAVPVDALMLEDVPPAYVPTGGNHWLVDHANREDSPVVCEDMDELPF